MSICASGVFGYESDAAALAQAAAGKLAHAVYQCTAEPNLVRHERCDMTSTKSPPQGWPPDTKYVPILDLTNPRIDADLKVRMRELVSKYQSKVAPSRGLVRIRTISDPRHPAHGQRGLFAAQNLRPKQWIINYGGELVRDDEPQTETSDYCLGYVRGYCIDACKGGNEARFANDFRGVPGASRNNIEFS